MSVRAFRKKKRKPQGLGDTVEDVFSYVGVNKVVKAVERVTKKDCGCGKRKDKLNKLVPYR